MRVLVTGGCGYIGGFTVEALVNAGHDVKVVDPGPGTRHSGVEYTQNHIGSACADKCLVKWTEAIIHLAGLPYVYEGEIYPRDYIQTNVMETIAIAKAFSVKIIFASSCTADTGSVYAMTKRISEEYLEAMKWPVILRYFNVAGASAKRGENHPDKGRLIYNVCSQDTIKVNGTSYKTADGTCIRDYVHVEDVARANVMALTAKPGTYEVGSADGYSVMDVISKAREYKELRHTYGMDRPGDVPRLVADPKNFIPGWHPTHNLESIIKSQKDWYESCGKYLPVSL